MKNNSRKIFDIIPPRKISEEEKISFSEKDETFNSVLKNNKKEEIVFSESQSPVAKKPVRKKRRLVLIFILLLVAGFLGSYFTSQAQVEIWPKGELLESKEEFKIDLNQKEIDFDKKIIPGKMFEVANIFSEEFSSSGKILKKSEGIIRLYNNYSTNQESWRAGTRFVSSEGKLFLSKDRIVVPGEEIKGGKISSVWVDIPVVAAEAGSDYNIKPSHFSVIAYLGTERYTKFYGESFEAMKGGGEASVVSDEDIKNAEKALREKAVKQNEKSLREKIIQGFIFLEGAQKTEILEAKPLAIAGDELEKFKFQVNIKSASAAFSKEDGNNLVRQIIESKTTQEEEALKENNFGPPKKPKEDMINVKYGFKESDDKSGIILADLDLSAKVYPEINETELKNSIKGKNLTEAQGFLAGLPFIEKIYFKIWPFWVKKIPEDVNKIKVKLNFL